MTTVLKREAEMADRTVLVIEDDPLNMKLVNAILGRGNYRVIQSMDAETGIMLAREHRPGLILMDIQLPGLDGLSATRLIKQDAGLMNTPVVALTSYAMEGDREKAMEAGCSDYITKPIDTRSFLDRIARVARQDEKGRTSKGGKYMKKIMIVDDEPLNIKLLAARLNQGKYDIITTYSGEEALEKVFEFLPDLILLDIMMPGLDGYEVARRLKGDPRTSDIPIIMITTLDDADDKHKALEVGADEFLNKPVDPAELQIRVQSLLRLKEYREQLTGRTESKKAFTPASFDEPLTEQAGGLPVVLLVEDDKKDAKLLKTYLHDGSYHVRITPNGEDALFLCGQGNVDVVLLDLVLPGLDGFEVCQQLKENKDSRNIQVVIITSLQDLDSRIKGIELGADEFLAKPINKQEIRARVNALLKKKAYLDRLSARVETALHAAITDKLTGLYNHTFFKHSLGLEIERSERQKHMFALLMMDIDDFKKINDELGHLAGDDILNSLGHLIWKNIREVDLAARYGGEEFAVLLPYADRQNAAAIATRLLKKIGNHPFHYQDCSFPARITVSIGLAIWPSDASTRDALIQKADDALYRAKKMGKNRLCMWEE
jgi:two-component system cell cycle response regulator